MDWNVKGRRPYTDRGRSNIHKKARDRKVEQLLGKLPVIPYALSEEIKETAIGCLIGFLGRSSMWRLLGFALLPLLDKFRERAAPQ